MRENNEEEQFVPSAFFQAPNQMASKTPKMKKKWKNTWKPWTYWGLYFHGNTE